MAEPVPVFTGTVSNPYPQLHAVRSNFSALQTLKANIYRRSLAATACTAAPRRRPSSPRFGPKHSGGYTLAVLLGAIAGGLAYCNWWLNDRLICLPVDPETRLIQTISLPLQMAPRSMFAPSACTSRRRKAMRPIGRICPLAWETWTRTGRWTSSFTGTQPTQPPIDVLITETTAIQSLNLKFANEGDGQSDNFTIPNVYDDGSSSQYANSRASSHQPRPALRGGGRRGRGELPEVAAGAWLWRQWRR